MEFFSNTIYCTIVHYLWYPASTVLSSPIQCSTLFTDDPQVKGNCVLDIDMDGIPNSDVRRPKRTSNKVHACKIHTYIEHGRITNASGTIIRTCIVKRILVRSVVCGVCYVQCILFVPYYVGPM